MDHLIDGTYLKRTWLNSETSPSTGSCVAFHGQSRWGSQEITSFFEIADCHCKVRLHRSSFDSVEEFCEKLLVLSKEAKDFADWLKNGPTKNS